MASAKAIAVLRIHHLLFFGLVRQKAALDKDRGTIGISQYLKPRAPHSAIGRTGAAERRCMYAMREPDISLIPTVAGLRIVAMTRVGIVRGSIADGCEQYVSIPFADGPPELKWILTKTSPPCARQKAGRPSSGVVVSVSPRQ